MKYFLLLVSITTLKQCDYAPLSDPINFPVSLLIANTTIFKYLQCGDEEKVDLHLVAFCWFSEAMFLGGLGDCLIISFVEPNSKFLAEKLLRFFVKQFINTNISSSSPTHHRFIPFVKWIRLLSATFHNSNLIDDCWTRKLTLLDHFRIVSCSVMRSSTKLCNLIWKSFLPSLLASVVCNVILICNQSRCRWAHIWNWFAITLKVERGKICFRTRRDASETTRFVTSFS